ncbi:TnsA endonuclease N-terminal domain-containing protein [Azospirillum palustre]|nr:TnsA endonuclease N-terminal domain-containing protein [Azospirillum palustre]
MDEADGDNAKISRQYGTLSRLMLPDGSTILPMNFDQFFAALNVLLEEIEPQETRSIIRLYLGLPEKGAVRTMAAVARMLEVKPGRVKSSLSEGRRKLRHKIKFRKTTEAGLIAEMRSEITVDRDLAKALFDWLYNGKPASNPAMQVRFVLQIMSEKSVSKNSFSTLASSVSAEIRTGSTRLSPRTPEQFVERLLSQACFPDSDRPPTIPPAGEKPARGIPRLEHKHSFRCLRPPRESLNRRALGVSISGSKVGRFRSKRDGYNLVPHESKAERAYIEQIDSASTVDWYRVQPLAISYRALGSERVYYPDLMLRMNDGRVLVVEVKSALEICTIDTLRKAVAGRRYCKANGWGYLLAAEAGLGIGDLMKYPVPPVERLADFISAVDETGIKRQDLMSRFPAVGRLRGQELTALLLQNDLVLQREPSWLIRRVPAEFGWKSLLPQEVSAPASPVKST